MFDILTFCNRIWEAKKKRKLFKTKWDSLASLFHASLYCIFLPIFLTTTKHESTNQSFSTESTTISFTNVLADTWNLHFVNCSVSLFLSLLVSFVFFYIFYSWQCWWHGWWLTKNHKSSLKFEFLTHFSGFVQTFFYMYVFIWSVCLVIIIFDTLFYVSTSHKKTKRNFCNRNFFFSSSSYSFYLWLTMNWEMRIENWEFWAETSLSESENVKMGNFLDFLNFLNFLFGKVSFTSQFFSRLFHPSSSSLTCDDDIIFIHNFFHTSHLNSHGNTRE